MLIESTALLLAIRLGLWLLPFNVLRRLVRAAHRTARGAAMDSVKDIAWAVSVARRYVPRATCLTQALAVEALLCRRGYIPSVRFGVRKKEGALIEAHAWVECAGQVVVGGPESLLLSYTPLTERERLS
ncbi:MAG: lasso peptide biosynthesis B2 protein [Chloroflexi bacterium]|nr:lasso peptide biosynthesis B2 protein [Chloroflexota bacterium]